MLRLWEIMLMDTHFSIVVRIHIVMTPYSTVHQGPPTRLLDIKTIKTSICGTTTEQANFYSVNKGHLVSPHVQYVFQFNYPCYIF
jgi:hypothetical protein